MASDESAASTNVVDAASVGRAVTKALVDKKLTAQKDIAFEREKDAWTFETYATFAEQIDTGAGRWKSMYCTLTSNAAADALKVSVSKGTSLRIAAVQDVKVTAKDVMVQPGQRVKVTEVHFALDLQADDPSEEHGLTTSCQLWEKSFFSSAALAVD